MLFLTLQQIRTLETKHFQDRNPRRRRRQRQRSIDRLTPIISRLVIKTIICSRFKRNNNDEEIKKKQSNYNSQLSRQ